MIMGVRREEGLDGDWNEILEWNRSHVPDYSHVVALSNPPCAEVA